MARPDSLWCQVIKAKYFPSNSPLEAEPTSEASVAWKSILATLKGTARVSGDGLARAILHPLL